MPDQIERVILLDIDGVLNTVQSSGTYTLERACIDALSHIIRETAAKIVVTSSWRYFIHNGYMTEKGFEVMLRSHGMTGLAEVIGTTRPDIEDELRGVQISDWLKGHKVQSFVILDDDSISGFDGRFVQTSDKTGLTMEDAERAIEVLSAKQP